MVIHGLVGQLSTLRTLEEESAARCCPPLYDLKTGTMDERKREILAADSFTTVLVRFIHPRISSSARRETSFAHTTPAMKVFDWSGDPKAFRF